MQSEHESNPGMEQQPAPRNRTVEELRGVLAGMADQLTPDVEPAIVYVLQQDTGQADG